MLIIVFVVLLLIKLYIAFFPSSQLRKHLRKQVAPTKRIALCMQCSRYPTRTCVVSDPKCCKNVSALLHTLSYHIYRTPVSAQCFPERNFCPDCATSRSSTILSFTKPCAILEDEVSFYVHGLCNMPPLNCSARPRSHTAMTSCNYCWR